MAVTGTNISITKRLVKGSALTYQEMDDNLSGANGLETAIENHSHDEFATDAELNAAKGIVATITYNANITWNWSTHSNATLTLTGNSTFGALSGLTTGDYASLRVVQGGSGNYGITFNASSFKGISELSLSPDIGAVDWLLFRAKDATTVELVGYRNNIGA